MKYNFLIFIPQSVATKYLIMANKKQSADISFDRPALRTSVLFFRAIAHKDRQKILQLIIANESIQVVALLKKIKVDAAILSQHLNVLKMANLVTSEREGRNFRYRINQAGYKKLKPFLK